MVLPDRNQAGFLAEEAFEVGFDSRYLTSEHLAAKGTRALWYGGPCYPWNTTTSHDAVGVPGALILLCHVGCFDPKFWGLPPSSLPQSPFISLGLWLSLLITLCLRLSSSP